MEHSGKLFRGRIQKQNQEARKFKGRKTLFFTYIVKLVLAKLRANSGLFTCGSQVPRPHTQFSCFTCSLSAKTGSFTRVYVANTSHRLHAKCLQPPVNLLEYNGYFRIHFEVPVTHGELMQICHQLAYQRARFCRQKTCHWQAKTVESQKKILAKRSQK